MAEIAEHIEKLRAYRAHMAAVPAAMALAKGLVVDFDGQPMVDGELNKLADEIEAFEKANAEAPIALLLTQNDHIAMLNELRKFVGVHVRPSLFESIPIHIVPGLRTSVTLLPDGTTKPLPRKT